MTVAWRGRGAAFRIAALCVPCAGCNVRLGEECKPGWHGGRTSDDRAAMAEALGFVTVEDAPARKESLHVASTTAEPPLALWEAADPHGTERHCRHGPGSCIGDECRIHVCERVAWYAARRAPKG